MMKYTFLSVFISLLLSFSFSAFASTQPISFPIYIQAFVGTLPPPPPSPPTGGPLIFDFTPPRLFDIKIRKITYNSAEISWRTNEDSIFQLNYGETKEYRNTIFGKEFKKEGVVTLKNLLSETVYHFEIIVKDRAGNKTSSGDYSFKTLPPPPFTECRGADLNFDGMVNIIDFSILLYSWQSTAPENACADISRNGVVNLTDFSIMMYYWTG